VKDVLANRSFLSVWSAMFVSGLGDKIVLIALFSLVLDRTGDVASLGLLAAMQILPGILLGPAVGVLLDRCSRKAVMVWSDLGSAVAVALIPFAPSLAGVYALTLVVAVGRQFSGPARLTLLPEIVPRSHLQQTNALAMLTTNVVLLVGMAAGGLIVASLGVRTAFLADAGTFLASALILVSVRFRYLPPEDVESDETSEPPPIGSTSPASLWREAGRGAVWIWREPRLRFAVAFLAVVTVVTAMQPPLVFDFIRNGLGRGEGELGFIFAAAGLGGLVGAVAAGLSRDNARPLVSVTWLVALDGLLLIAFTLNRTLAGAILLFGAFGAISTGLQVNLTTFLQRETPPERRGRIFGWLNPLLGPMSLLSVLAGPLLARVVGVARVLFAAGVFEIGAGLGGRVLLPRLRTPAGSASARPEGASARGVDEEPPEKPKAMAGEA